MGVVVLVLRRNEDIFTDPRVRDEGAKNIMGAIGIIYLLGLEMTLNLKNYNSNLYLFCLQILSYLIAVRGGQARLQISRGIARSWDNSWGD